MINLVNPTAFFFSFEIQEFCSLIRVLDGKASGIPN